MSRQPGHWAQVAAGLFVPTRDKLIAERLLAVESAAQQPAIEAAELVRAAKARAAGVPVPPPEPVLPVEELVERERCRLAAMTTEEILAEREAEERECAAMIEEAKRIAAARRERWLKAAAPGWFDEGGY